MLISRLIFINRFQFFFMYVFRDNCERWVNVTSASDLGKGEEYGSMKKEISPPYVIESGMGIS